MPIFTNICRVTSYIIAYSCIIAAATNDGFSSYIFGIPFVIFLALDAIILILKKSPISIIHIVFLVISIYTAKNDRSNWKLIHPLINEKITIISDINITHNKFYPYEISFPISKKSDYTLRKGNTFVIKRQIVTGHPDFGISYIFQLENTENINAITKFIQDANNLKVEYWAVGNTYRELNKTKIYIDSWNLLEDKYFSCNTSKLNRFHIFGGLLIYVIYTPVFLLFFIISIIYLSKYLTKRKKKSVSPASILDKQKNSIS